MTLVLSAAIAAASPLSTGDVAAKVDCAARPGVDGHLCLAFHHSQQQKFAEAALEFEKAAQLSQAITATGGDARADRALAAAGNMWLAAGEPGKAALAIDRALAGGTLQAEQHGEALLDRARAAEAQNDLKTARAKVDEAAETIAEDPFYWYFAAALAIREGDKARAQRDIGRALVLAPADPTILFEAGHVAHFAGDAAKARDYWTRAAAADPEGTTGRAAKQALALLGAPAAVQSVGNPPK